MSDENEPRTKSSNDEKIANALFHLSASLVALKEIVKDQGADRRQDHDALRDAIGDLATAVSLVHQKLDITREGVTEANKIASETQREITNPSIKIPSEFTRDPDDLVIPAKWRTTLEMVMRKILPWIIVGGGFGAMARDCTGTLFGSSTPHAADAGIGIYRPKWESAP